MGGVRMRRGGAGWKASAGERGGVRCAGAVQVGRVSWLTREQCGLPTGIAHAAVAAASGTPRKACCVSRCSRQSSGDSSATAIRLWFQGGKHSIDAKRHGTAPECSSSCSLSIASASELQCSPSTSPMIVMCTSKAGRPFSLASFWTSAESSAFGFSGGTSQQEMGVVWAGGAPEPPPITPGLG